MKRTSIVGGWCTLYVDKCNLIYHIHLNQLTCILSTRSALAAHFTNARRRTNCWRVRLANCTISIFLERMEKYSKKSFISNYCKKIMTSIITALINWTLLLKCSPIAMTVIRVKNKTHQDLSTTRAKFEENPCTLQTFLYRTSSVIYKGKDGGVIFYIMHLQFYCSLNI